MQEGALLVSHVIFNAIPYIQLDAIMRDVTPNAFTRVISRSILAPQEAQTRFEKTFFERL
jgi:hypothetical protein